MKKWFLIFALLLAIVFCVSTAQAVDYNTDYTWEEVSFSIPGVTYLSFKFVTDTHIYFTGLNQNIGKKYLYNLETGGSVELVPPLGYEVTTIAVTMNSDAVFFIVIEDTPMGDALTHWAYYIYTGIWEHLPLYDAEVSNSWHSREQIFDVNNNGDVLSKWLSPDEYHMNLYGEDTLIPVVPYLLHMNLRAMNNNRVMAGGCKLVDLPEVPSVEEVKGLIFDFDTGTYELIEVSGDILGIDLLDINDSGVAVAEHYYYDENGIPEVHVSVVDNGEIHELPYIFQDPQPVRNIKITNNGTIWRYNNYSGLFVLKGTPKPLNQAPLLAVNQNTVTIREGQEATNSGTVSDADGDSVVLTASVGTVINNYDGTWSWSLQTTDGPVDSQTVTITADDGNNGTYEMTFELTVNNVSPTVDTVNVPLDPIQLGSFVFATANFSDPGEDEPFTATFNYGDGSEEQEGTVVNTTCTGPEHYYGSPGIYIVSATVTDEDGESGTASAENFIVIFDQNAGYVTGGGWIDSPAGAYVADPTLAGKANFGFLSKYKKGTTVPTGQTEFQFQTSNLNFHSDSYEWLVVTGDNYARFKGSGTINGMGDYKFMLWAGDGEPDTFRIRIWEEDEITAVESDVYDNGIHQEIGGGSIMVHTKK